MDATLSRGGESITIPLIEEGSGTVLVGRDVGHPSMQIHETGDLDPIFTDVYSGIETFVTVGRFRGDSAYQDAIDLADMVKSHGAGSGMTFSVPVDRFDDATVVPAAEQEQAVTLTYPPGRRNDVAVELSLTRVSQWLGASDPPASQIASTPTASGSGPIQLTDGSTTVDLTKDINVERSVGRPNSTLSRATDQLYPRYEERIKSAHDTFSLSVTFNENTETTVRELNDLVSQRLGRTPLTLDFQGTFGLGAFNVVPSGSQAKRDVLPGAYAQVNMVPTLDLRVVSA